MTWIALFFKNYFKEIAAIVLIVLACFFGYNAIYDRGYSAGESKYNEYIAKIEKENAELGLKKNKVLTEVQIVYKDRIKYIEKKSESVKEEIKNGALVNEKADCRIGPNFVRLHNLSAEPSTTSDSSN